MPFIAINVDNPEKSMEVYKKYLDRIDELVNLEKQVMDSTSILLDDIKKDEDLSKFNKAALAQLIRSSLT